jgi:hypothetical protein
MSGAPVDLIFGHRVSPDGFRKRQADLPACYDTRTLAQRAPYIARRRSVAASAGAVPKPRRNLLNGLSSLVGGTGIEPVAPAV